MSLNGVSGSSIEPVKSMLVGSSDVAVRHVDDDEALRETRGRRALPRRSTPDRSSSRGWASAAAPARRRPHRREERRVEPGSRVAHGVPPACAIQKGVGLGQRHQQLLDVAAASLERASRALSSVHASLVGLAAPVGEAEPLRGVAAAAPPRCWRACSASSTTPSNGAVDVAADELAGRVDRLAVLLGAEAADGVVVLEAEADAGPSAVAAACRPGPPSAAAKRSRAVESGSGSGAVIIDVRRRRRHRVAEELLAHQLAAVHRRGLVGVRVDGEQAAEGQDAGALRRDRGRPCANVGAARAVDAVEGRPARRS